jgi:YD repeat-containing protein
MQTRWFPGAGAVLLALAIAAGESDAATQTVTYAYDAIGRLTRATYDDTLTATFTHDAGGNLTSIAVASGTVSAPAAEASGVLALGPAVPTPFRGTTRLHFDLPAPSRVRLAVFDLSGRRVRTLAQGLFAAGRHAATWDGLDDRGVRAGNGLYFARLEAAAGARSRRIVHLD